MTRDSKCGFPFNDDDKAVARADLRIGAIMPDGTIYAGISPRTDTPMYVMPQDAPLTMTFKKANRYAAGLDAYSHHDWRVPQLPELAALFNNRAALGGFNLTRSEPAGRYWSSWQHLFIAWGMQFRDGSKDRYGVFGDRLSLRCVRAAPAGDLNAAVQNVEIAHDINVTKPLPRADKPARHFEL